ncbi:MAG: GntR family transcriptional regulator [Actinomycetota bacterium]
MATVEPIERASLSDRVADEVRRRIWTGELRGGDRLGQEELASSLGVSRVPVREALIALTHQGVVRTEPHRGSFVEALSATAITDHYDLYAHLDGFALRKAVERAGPSERRGLAALMVAAGDVTVAASMQSAVAEIRSSFHRLGGSPRFHAVARGLAGIVPGNFFHEVAGSIDVACAAYPPMGAAVAQGDAASAVERYETMIRGHGELVLAVLRRATLVAE